MDARPALTHLALEVKSLDRARAFYEGRLGLEADISHADADDADADDADGEQPGEVAYRVGETTLTLRRPTSFPRGGLHVHYAFSTTREGYEPWRGRLSDLDPLEKSFGSYRSLYVDDPDDHCVEVGDNGEGGGDGLVGVFELVLEVESVERAEARYRALGFEPVDRGERRRRVRLQGGFDLELWEPQLGIADARGGVHVDFGLRVDDAEAALDAFESECGTLDAEDLSGGDRRVRDPDGHFVTLRE